MYKYIRGTYNARRGCFFFSWSKLRLNIVHKKPGKFQQNFRSDKTFQGISAVGYRALPSVYNSACRICLCLGKSGSCGCE